MKKTKLFFVMAFIACSLCTATTHAEEIVLQDLYAIQPLDNSQGSWEDTGTDNHIVARFDGQAVKVDFKQPTGNVEVIISRGDGLPFKKQNAFNPQSMIIDMNGAETGRYLLEVYTDTEAVGGVFEVK